METIAEEINRWIKEHGSARDALNVALARLAALQRKIETLENILEDAETELEMVLHEYGIAHETPS